MAKLAYTPPDMLIDDIGNCPFSLQFVSTCFLTSTNAKSPVHANGKTVPEEGAERQDSLLPCPLENKGEN